MGSQLYAARSAAYMSRMLGLTPSELGIVTFIFLLVVAAAKLPAWGEMLGGYLHRRARPPARDKKASHPPDGGAGGRNDG